MINGKSALIESNPVKAKVLKKDNNILFECVLQQIDRPGQNGRIYPKILIESQLKKAEPKMKKNMMYGELDHPITNDPERIGQILLKEASHIVLDYKIGDENVTGVLQTLPTPNGKILEQLILNGNTVGVSLRALGSVKEVSQTRSIVEDMELIAYDIVSNPSFETALINKQSLVESVQYVFDGDKKVQTELFNYVFQKKIEQLFEQYNITGSKQRKLLTYIRENRGVKYEK